MLSKHMREYISIVKTFGLTSKEAQDFEQKYRQKYSPDDTYRHGKKTIQNTSAY